MAICQGQFVRCSAADKQVLIESEADSFLPPESNRHHVALTITSRRLIPSAGIDESNADGHYILWPSDPQCRANAVRSYLRDRFSRRRRVGVIITDSTTAPLRCGVTGLLEKPMDIPILLETMRRLLPDPKPCGIFSQRR